VPAFADAQSNTPLLSFRPLQVEKMVSLGLHHKNLVEMKEVVRNGLVVKRQGNQRCGPGEVYAQVRHPPARPPAVR